MEIQNIVVDLEKQYCCPNLSFLEILNELEKRYQNHVQVPFVETVIPNDAVIPDKTYVDKLLSGLHTIKNNLGKWEYDCCKKELQEISCNGDFDDAEEIMYAVHELIKKYIYGSDTKVSAEEWKNLEKYIECAGYVAVSVKAGDSVSPYKLYFDRPIAAVGGVPGTIKQIQQIPYTLKYYDGDQTVELKLCGKCTYFKFE